MTSAVLEVQGTITERGQTTVPAPIRQALGIGRRGFIVWRIDPDGAVRVTAVDEAEPDPALGRFLDLLEQDIGSRSAGLHGVSAGIQQRIAALVDGVEVDLEAPLADDED